MAVETEGVQRNGSERNDDEKQRHHLGEAHLDRIISPFPDLPLDEEPEKIIAHGGTDHESQVNKAGIDKLQCLHREGFFTSLGHQRVVGSSGRGNRMRMSGGNSGRIFPSCND